MSDKKSRRSPEKQAKIDARKAEAKAAAAAAKEQAEESVDGSNNSRRNFLKIGGAVGVLAGLSVVLWPDPKPDELYERKPNLDGITIDENLTVEALIDKLVANGNRVIMAPDTDHTNLHQETYYGEVVLPAFAKAVKKHFPGESITTGHELPYNEVERYRRIKNQPDKDIRFRMLERDRQRDHYYINALDQKAVIASRLSVIDAAREHGMRIEHYDIKTSDNNPEHTEVLIKLLELEKAGVSEDDPLVQSLIKRNGEFSQERLDSSNPFTAKRLLQTDGFVVYRPGSAHTERESDLDEMVGAPTIQVVEKRGKATSAELRSGSDGADFDIIIPDKTMQEYHADNVARIYGHKRRGEAGVQANMESCFLMLDSYNVANPDARRDDAALMTRIDNLHRQVQNKGLGFSWLSVTSEALLIEKEINNHYPKEDVENHGHLLLAKEALMAARGAMLELNSQPQSPTRNGFNPGGVGPSGFGR